MVGRAEWTQALEHQKSPNALGPSALRHWVTSDALGPESTQPSRPCLVPKTHVMSDTVSL